jgi:hypothetical protein
MKSPSSSASHRSSETRELPIDTIDWSLTLRGIQRGHIGRLAGVATLPSVVVWECEKGKFRGVDGFHRWHLAKLRRQRTIQAVIRHYATGQSGERQFEFDCIRMNIQHGLPLTREERDRAILRLWDRWGRNESRPHGVSLEEIGGTFNLTRQRIQQIVFSTSPSEAAVDPRLADAQSGRAHGDQTTDASLLDTCREVVQQRHARSSGYSSLARFSAAAKRLSTVLGDAVLVRDLFDEHEDEVRERLRELRHLLDGFLDTGVQATSSAFASSDRSTHLGGQTAGSSRSLSSVKGDGSSSRRIA